jgi:hypothetical protein
MRLKIGEYSHTVSEESGRGVGTGPDERFAMNFIGSAPYQKQGSTTGRRRYRRFLCKMTNTITAYLLEQRKNIQTLQMERGAYNLLFTPAIKPTSRDTREY